MISSRLRRHGLAAVVLVCGSTACVDRIDHARVAAATDRFDRTLVMRMGSVIRAAAAADSLSTVTTEQAVGTMNRDAARAWLQRIGYADLSELPQTDTLWTRLSEMDDLEPPIAAVVSHVLDSRRRIDSLLESVGNDRMALDALTGVSGTVDGQLLELRAQPDVLLKLRDSLRELMRAVGTASVTLGQIREDLEA